MNLLADIQLSNFQDCPYLPDRQMRLAFFYANEVKKSELNALLSCGWRKFGIYYFRPKCENCCNCIPVRVPVASFSMSKSQRRIWNRNSDIEVNFEKEAPIDKLYEIYEEHSKKRFGTVADRSEFEFNFFIESCPSFFSLYYLDGMLVAAGFLDFSSNALSSVYFIYRPPLMNRGLGNFSILKEIEKTKDLGLHHYYLGYYVQGNSRMQYKTRFRPFEWYSWETGNWEMDNLEKIE